MVTNLSQVTRGQERNPTTGEATASLTNHPEQRWQQNVLCSELLGKPGTAATCHLPTWSAKRDPTCQGALLTLGSYMWLAHLARLHRIPAAYSTQEGIPMIPPSKVCCVHSQQSGSWSNHLSTTVYYTLQAQMFAVSTLSRVPFEGSVLSAGGNKGSYTESLDILLSNRFVPHSHQDG